MKILKTTKQIITWRKASRDFTTGFVPTMGALHEGHAELIKKSLSQNDKTVASIFINPTQFNSASDLTNYPRTLSADLKILKKLRVDAVFLPTTEDIYADDYRFKLSEDLESQLLCGAHRPGHFDGVLTVVLKLLNLVCPTRAYFGEKDFQQFKLIRDMALALFLDIKIVAVPTKRAKSGLALSSRNARLDIAQTKKAALISRFLRNSRLSPSAVASKLQSAGLKVDYVTDQWDRRFVAARVGSVRLIDNLPLGNKKRISK